MVNFVPNHCQDDMGSNLSELEVTTYEVISDLWASKQVEDARMLSKLLVSAKQGNVEAMHDILAMAQPTWLGEVSMQTVTAENWQRKLEQLRMRWTQAVRLARGHP